MSIDLQELSRQIRDLQDSAAETLEAPSVEQRMASIHEKLGRRSQERQAALRREYAKNVLAGALGAAAAVLISWWMTLERPLDASLGDQRLTGGSWVATTDSERPVTFSDGSRLTLKRSARGRVLRLAEHGASFALERGTIHAQVVPHENNHWVVAAGPFEVLVTGTEFDASWDPETEALTVQMQHGSVQISGACLDGPRTLSGDQRGQFSCALPAPSAVPAPKPHLEALAAHENAEIPAEPGAETSHPRRPESVASGDPAPPPAAPSSAPSAARAPGEDWQALARAGRFKAALAAAEAHGFSSLCTSLPADQVLELGNVARLAGNPARASEAYTSARQRFGGSSAAATAAFQLGRLAFDGSRDYAGAQRWFAAYLSERPGGGLAQEALGRLMESEHHLGDASSASLHAAEYLKRFPHGPHAALAHGIGGE
ncbi:MAG: FecR domain-containing protein [Polyangiaceae bacterium]